MKMVGRLVFHGLNELKGRRCSEMNSGCGELWGEVAKAVRRIERESESEDEAAIDGSFGALALVVGLSLLASFNCWNSVPPL